MNHIDLCSGIGGFALACAWNGIEAVQFVEIDKRCREFLSKTWPGVPIHDDIKTFHWTGEPVYLLTEGVPCQPASRAGEQRGKEDDRWLWDEAVRCLAEIRPAWALFENPPGIGDVGLSGILAQMEAQDYEVRVVSIPACAVGSPQIRERYWIVAHNGAAGPERTERSGSFRQPGTSAHGAVAECLESQLADTRRLGSGQDEPGRGSVERTADRGAGEGMADSKEGRKRTGLCDSGQTGERGIQPADTNQWGSFVWLPGADGKVRRAPSSAFLLDHGVQPGLLGELEQTHRSALGALGNSIVPQVAYQIIKAIIKADKEEL